MAGILIMPPLPVFGKLLMTVLMIDANCPRDPITEGFIKMFGLLLIIKTNLEVIS